MCQALARKCWSCCPWCPYRIRQSVTRCLTTSLLVHPPLALFALHLCFPNSSAQPPITTAIFISVFPIQKENVSVRRGAEAFNLRTLIQNVATIIEITRSEGL
jgi:hypothetical protein